MPAGCFLEIEQAVRGFPRYHKQTLNGDLRRAGIPHAFIAEEGYLKGGLKRRLLPLLWIPQQCSPFTTQPS